MWPFAFALKKKRMSEVMFYLVQLFLMPSATSDLLHDLESPSFINCVYLLNIAHALWLTLNGIRLEWVWLGPAVALRFFQNFPFQDPIKEPLHLPVECPFYGSFWLWVIDKCLTASLSSTANVSLTYMMTSHSHIR